MADVSSAVIDRLFRTIEARQNANPDASYTASLLARGSAHCARKMGEEAIETVVAALAEDKKALVQESADLIYHLLVLWASKDVQPSDVFAALAQREGTSGHDEKASR